LFVFGDCLWLFIVLIISATAVAHQGISQNTFANEWTTSEPAPLTHSAIIDHIIQICAFHADSIMVKYICQQQWSTLAHVISVRLHEVNKFFTARKDDFTFVDTPLLVHLHTCHSRHSCCFTRAKLVGVMV
jgi:hypothetical protein